MIDCEDPKSGTTNVRLDNDAKNYTTMANICSFVLDFIYECCWHGSQVMFSSRLTGLLLCGPIALIGGKNGLNVLGESTCFALAGLALIPCAERLSFVTEEVAAHTNETIGALLNATFGNAPELLISTAALRFGFYRVVQLTLLGSILTNLLLVFGISCFIGGLRWQVQEVRLTSGNVSVSMLLIATTGLVLPMALKLSNEEMITHDANASLMFSRFNALVMVFMYFAYLLFQLGTHKEEFENYHDDQFFSNSKEINDPSLHNTQLQSNSRRNIKNAWCNKYIDSSFLPLEKKQKNTLEHSERNFLSNPGPEIEMTSQSVSDLNNSSDTSSDDETSIETNPLLPRTESYKNISFPKKPQSRPFQREGTFKKNPHPQTSPIFMRRNLKEKASVKKFIKRNKSDEYYSDIRSESNSNNYSYYTAGVQAQLSFRAGIFWLLTITVCISAMSDVLVDTIDGFAQKSHLSEIFTSVIIIPFFSNIAEQVSAVIFAYRNKMDLCVGITAGSAIQISLCVLPGTVLIGWYMDRSMSLFFNGFETCCLVMAVLSVSVILQGGTTNWLAGLYFIAIYLLIAAGFWFHVREDLSTDEEFLYGGLRQNYTRGVIGSYANVMISTQTDDTKGLGNDE